MPFRIICHTVALSILLVAGLVLSVPKAANATGLSAGGGAAVTAERLNLRGGPSSVNPIVGILPFGTSVRVLAGPVNGVWWRVSDGSRVGYVHGDWLEPATAPSDSAAFDLDLAVPFHRQMTAVWCEPADLQSWIEYVQGRPLGPDFTVQQDIWGWELSHNAGFTVDEWNCSPFAPASAARRWMPDRGFNHFMYDDPLAATNVMAWLMAHPRYAEPSIALIWQGEHYILVRGIRATADPSVDPTAQLLGVYIMDPNQGSRSWLGEDRFIPIEEWTTSYFTPVSYLTPHTGSPGDIWQNKYVTIQRDWENIEPTLAGRSNATVKMYEDR